MRASTESRVRAAATWCLLYVYAASTMFACAPQRLPEQEGADGLAGAQRHALAADFLETYTLASPDIDGPNGGLRGQTEFSHSVSSDGDLSIRVPIRVAPGRNGVQPNLEFVYSHRLGHGAVGQRWDISGFSRIHRCSRTKAFDGEWGVRAGTEWCLNGQRLIGLGTGADLQTLDGEIKVTTASVGFVTRARDGSKREYSFSPGQSTSPTEYFETAQEDVWGNRMEWKYNEDGSPSSIEYTSNAAAPTTDPNRFVDFTYEDRTGTKDSRATGGEIIPRERRLKKITLSAPANLAGQVRIVRRYHLTFTPDDFLSTVTECIPTQHQFERFTTRTVNERCYEPASFVYDSAPAAFEAKKSASVIQEFPQILDQRKEPTPRDSFLFGFSAQEHVNSLAVIDIDGDGILDLTYMKVSETSYVKVGKCLNGPLIQGTWFWKRGRGLSAAVPFEAEADLGLGAVTLEYASFPPRAIDVDGDGVTEILAGVTPECTPSGARILALAVQTKLPDGSWSQIDTTPANLLVGDVNGDARPDFTFIDPDRKTTPFTGPSADATAASGPLTLRLNTSSAGSPSLGAPSVLLSNNPCHEAPEWTGSVTCRVPGAGALGADGPPTPCDRCATDGFLRAAPSGGCSANCDVTGYAIREYAPFSASSGPTTSRASAVAASSLVDLDGNGVLEPIFRETVPPHDITYGSGQPMSLNTFWGAASDLAGSVVTPELPGKVYYAARFTGGGFSRHRVNAAEAVPMNYVVPERTRFADLNSDGLVDWLSFAPGKVIARLNRGDGVFGAEIPFDASSTSSIPGVTPDPADKRPKASLGDIDGDGRLDVVLVDSSRSISLSGLDWRERAAPLPRGEGVISVLDLQGNWTTSPLSLAASQRLVDLDNDGILDTVGLNQFAPELLVGDQARIFYSKNTARRTLLRTASSGPRSLTVTTKRYSEPQAPCAYPQSCATPDALFVVSATTETDSDAQALETQFSYQGSRSDLLGHGWLGFSTRTIAITARGVRRVEWFANAAADAVASGTCSGCYWYPGARRVSRVETTRDSRRDGSTSSVGQIVKTVDRFEYHDQHLAPGSTLVSYLKRHMMTESVGSAPAGQTSAPSFRATRSSLTTSSQTRGTLTLQKVSSWEGDALANGDAPLGANVKWTQQSSDLQPTDDRLNWLIGLPWQLTTSSQWPGSSVVSRVVQFEYEQHKPVLKSVTVEPNSTSVEGPQTSGYKLKTELTRDPKFGAVTSVSETGNWQPYDQPYPSARTRTSQVTYDADWIFLRSATNPLQHTTEYYHLPFNGALVATSTNIGGTAPIDREILLDTAGRVVRTSGTGTPTSTFAYFSDRMESSNLPAGVSKTFIDAFDRPTRQEWVGWNGATIKQTYSYLPDGSLQSVSLPYETRPEYVSYSFDGLGRIVTESNSGTSELRQWSYDPAVTPHTAPYGIPHSWVTTVTTQAGSKEEILTDALGVTVRRRELLSQPQSVPARWSEQDFTFGAFGLLSRIEDSTNRQQPISFVYDVLGRQISVIDPNSGTREMRYTAFGELSRVSSPLHAIEFKRDSLSRVVSRRTTPAAGTPVEATFTWDTAPNARGQLISSSENNVQHNYTYNSLGLLATEFWKIGNASYQSSMEYDQYSRLEYLTYPEMGAPATKIKYTYGADGRVNRVEDRSTTNSTRIFWSALARNAAGLVTASQSGASAGFQSNNTNLLTKRVYDRGNRLTNVDVTNLQRQRILALRYEYGLKGVQARHDRSEPGNFVSEDFGHDLAGRLTDWSVHHGNGATCTQGSRTQFEYSATGNLERETLFDSSGFPVGTPTVSAYWGGNQPSNLSSRSENGATTTYTPDVTGNQTLAELNGTVERRASFRADGQLATAESPLGSWRMDYDASGERVRVQNLANPNADAIDLGGLMSRHPDGRLSLNVIVDNEVVAIVSKSAASGTWLTDVRYVFSDMLGSPSLITSETGTVVDRPRYNPFGERRENTNLNVRSAVRHPERLGFAAHVPDDDWNALKVGARSLDTVTTRFLSPDPVYSVGQELNGYSYSQNAPVNRVDPSGLASLPANCISIGGGSDGCYSGSTSTTAPASGAPFSPGGGPAQSQANFIASLESAGTLSAHVDDNTRTEPAPATAGQAAASFAKGFVVSFGMAVGTAYVLGGIAAFCAPCAIGLGLGLLAKGVYELVNGGAAALVESGGRIWDGEGTPEDWQAFGGVVGAIAGGRLGRTAFNRGVADGRAARGALTPKSGCTGGSCGIDGPGCFTPDTRVMMADGSSKPISAVDPGDLVLSRNSNNEVTGAIVTARLSNFTHRLAVISVSSALGTGSIEATTEHPIWVESKGWVEAGRLNPGDRLFDASGAQMSVVSVSFASEETPTFNLSIEETGTFFVVSDAGAFLVHNQVPTNMNAPGYWNYHLLDRWGVPYYNGMAGPNETPASVELRHRTYTGPPSDPKRFAAPRMGPGDSLKPYKGFRTYREARVYEHLRTVIERTFTGKTDVLRGNRQAPIGAKNARLRQYFPNGDRPACP